MRLNLGIISRYQAAFKGGSCFITSSIFS